MRWWHKFQDPIFACCTRINLFPCFASPPSFIFFILLVRTRQADHLRDDQSTDQVSSILAKTLPFPPLLPHLFHTVLEVLCERCELQFDSSNFSTCRSLVYFDGHLGRLCLVCQVPTSDYETVFAMVRNVGTQAPFRSTLQVQACRFHASRSVLFGSSAGRTYLTSIDRQFARFCRSRTHGDLS